MTDKIAKFPIKAAQMQPPPQQQIHVDLTNAKQKECECGCKFFEQVITVFTVSALASPTGKELTATQPVLVCKDCGIILK